MYNGKIPVPIVRRNCTTPRDRLNQKFDKVLERAVTIVHAQAGFGKSTAVDHWLQSRGIKHHWIKFDESDDSAQKFWDYLHATVKNLDPQQRSNLKLDLPNPLDAQLVADHTARILALATETTDREPVVLVLDQFHHISCNTTLNCFDHFLNQLPPLVHVVIISRATPNLKLSKLKIQGQLLEINAQQLRLDASECKILVNNETGISLSDAAAKTLTEKTHGWIAAVRLLCMDISEFGKGAEIAFADPANHPAIRRYFLDEVLAQQPPVTREFLLRTSLLPTFNYGLLIALGYFDEHTAEATRHAHAYGLIDSHWKNGECWYTYAGLFRQLLATHRDNYSPPPSVDMLHQAIEWYCTNDQITHAAELAVERKLWDSLELVLERVFASRINTELDGKIIRWLKSIPHQVVLNRPLLILYCARTDYFTETSDKIVGLVYAEDMVRNAIAENQSNPTRLAKQKKLLFEILIEQAAAQQKAGNDAQVEQLLAQAERSRPADHQLGQCRIHCIRGMHYLERANEPAAIDEFASCLSRAIVFGHAELVVRALSYLTRSCLTNGRLDFCLHAHRRVERWMRNQGLVNSRLNRLAGAAKALVHIERMDLESARSTFANYHELIADNDSGSIFDNLNHFMLFALTCYFGASREYNAALNLIESNEGRVTDGTIQWDFRRSTNALRAKYQLYMGDRVSARRWVDGYLHDYRKQTAANRHYVNEPDLLVAAEILVHTDSPKDALTLTTSVRARAEEGQRHLAKVKSFIIAAAAYAQMNDRTQAINSLNQAIDISDRTGKYILQFVESRDSLASIVKDSALSRPLSSYQHVLARQLRASNGQIAGRDHLYDLTGKEVEIMECIKKGMANKEIARNLFLSVTTVKWYTHIIYQKLGVKSRTEAAAKWRPA